MPKLYILKFNYRYGISHGCYITEFPRRNNFFFIPEDGSLPRFSNFIGCYKSVTRFVVSPCVGVHTLHKFLSLQSLGMQSPKNLTPLCY
jgi:hypothetical protein